MSGYDVCIGYSFNKPSICLINPDLLKEYFSKPLNTYIKVKKIVKYMDKIELNNIFFSEGE
jgi:hypothetical protein